MIKDHYTSMADFEQEVQEAQSAYSDTMEQLYQEVQLGTITEAQYWSIGNGTPLMVCGAKIKEATRKWDEFTKSLCN